MRCSNEVSRVNTTAFDTPERRALLDTVRRFTETEVPPHLGSWERAGEMPRELHRSADALAVLAVKTLGYTL